jgi:hypothetical protein
MSITHTPPPVTTAVSLPSDQLAHVRALKATVRAAEAQILVAACEWADSHPALPDHPEPYAAERCAAVRRQDAGWLAQQDPFDLDDPDASIPEIAWDADAPFAAALGLSTAAGARLLREALVLRHRLPRLWQRMLAGEVEAGVRGASPRVPWASPPT